MTVQASAESLHRAASSSSCSPSRPSAASLAELSRRFGRTRRLTEALAEPLSAEDQTVQSMPDTSPTKWHRAHTTWFFETFLLRPHLRDYEEFHPDFNYLFNSYYEAVGDRHPRPDRGLVTRPGVAEVAAYRRHVDQAMAQLIGAAPDAAEPHVVAEMAELGIQHEQQHQELLLMDIKHVLSNSIADPAYAADVCRPDATDPGPAGWVRFEEAIVAIGREPGSAGFRFDNEQPQHQTLVQPYRLADRLVTCGEWLEFMADGGYRQPGLWLSDGWHHARSQGWDAPLYWQQSSPDEGWSVHTLGGERPVHPHEPVCHVSFYEADAFATWAGGRLPTEFEWEAAASTTVDAAGALLQSADGDASVSAINALHPTAAGPSTGALRQLIGDCWEWTGSPYRPYPGYQVPGGAVGEYNGKFMINTMVLRGGCALTPADHIRPTYRNFFHPHTRWHLSGVRLAADN